MIDDMERQQWKISLAQQANATEMFCDLLVDERAKVAELEAEVERLRAALKDARERAAERLRLAACPLECTPTKIRPKSCKECSEIFGRGAWGMPYCTEVEAIMAEDAAIDATLANEGAANG
jgi:hypothetical protein